MFPKDDPTMTSSPQFSPQDLAILAEIKFQREKLARLEAKQDSLYGLDPVNERYVGGQIQADLDEAYAFHGSNAPAQKEGESASTYRRRLLAGLTRYSRDPDVAKIDFTAASGYNGIPNWAVAKYADQIKADALDPASHKADVPAGQIKEIIKRDEGGRKVHEFVSSDHHTTFINDTGPNSLVAQGVIGARRVVSRFFGRDRVGNISTAPVQKPVYAGRMSLRGGLPRSA
jgi:hypothetical protein